MNLKSVLEKRKPLLLWVVLIALVLTAWIALHAALISWDGFADTYSSTEPSDAAVVLGNQVFANATPGDLLEGRLKKALSLNHAGAVRNIVCSGGKGPANVWEADVMRAWLIARGVDASKIVCDYEGKDSYCTAREAKKIFDIRGWKSAVIVSHFTHISRCKLAFRRFGLTELRSAHADFSPGDFKAFPHEIIGYYYYWIRN